MRNIQPLNMLYAISPNLDNQNVESENYCILTLQTNFTVYVLPVRIKKESDLSHSESFPCLQLEEKFKEESIRSGVLIDEKERLVDRTLVIRMAQQCEDDLPAGLIPPVEIDDEECDITWTEKSNKCLDKPFKKKVNTAKVKPGASDTGKRYKGKQRKAQKHKSRYCGKANDGRTLKMQTKKHGEAFRCETCGKDFKRSDLLTDHVKVHKRKRPYPCDECGMMFAKPAYLKIHLRRHAGERAFTCDQCEKRFFDKYDLNVHLRDHTGERPYVCPECGKGFKRIYILNKHKRTHSKEKPFQCNVCGKAYRYVYSYRLHMKDHSA